MSQSALRALFLHRGPGIGRTFVSADVGRLSVPGVWRRTALMAGCGISICVAAYLGDPTSAMHADPALARLLRGMAVIKGMIAIAAIAAVFWRVGRPVAKPVAAGYLVGSWALVGSTTLIWQLSWIPAAAILFHAAALSMLFVSWRER